MKLETLQSEIEDIVQDPAYTGDYVVDLINEAVSVIARGVEVPGELGITSPLPDLFTTGTVTLTDSARHQSLPDDYQRNVIGVYSSGGVGQIPVMDSFQKFMQKYPVLETGSSLDAVVVHGKNLFYHPAVSLDVTVMYYRQPDELEVFDDEPDCIPEPLQRPLLISYACEKIFNRIEDGIEGAKVNTNHYKTEFLEAVMALDRFIGDDGVPHYIDDAEAFIL